MPSFWLPSSGRQSRATASSDGPLTIYILTTAPKWPRNLPPPILGPFLFEFCADQSGAAWEPGQMWAGKRVGEGCQKPKLLPFVTRKQNLFPVYGAVF